MPQYFLPLLYRTLSRTSSLRTSCTSFFTRPSTFSSLASLATPQVPASKQIPQSIDLRSSPSTSSKRHKKPPKATENMPEDIASSSSTPKAEESNVENSFSAGATRADAEALIKRNPHPNFKQVESTRPPFPDTAEFLFTKSPVPAWTPGTPSPAPSAASTIPHREINPYMPGRSPVDNYKLLISGIIPRPIGFLSTLTPAGTSNLAPFSYTTIVNHDPPIFCVGFSGGTGNLKDSCQNLLDTGECTINIISEWFVEAANYTSVNAPPGVSEWTLAGLTPAPSTNVKPPRVLESAFSIEGRLLTHHEWTSPQSGKKTGVTCLIQGVNFWVREDVVNKEGNMIDPNLLRPVSRLGGISYSRTTEGYELPRPDWEKEAKQEWERLGGNKAADA
ncbi:hypothetical protein DFH27DRAFT_556085 [Peziza echinospora]|nr:hypothetical protein DFH27DRAFT_556085 [Peziza echinospora]